MTPGRFKDLRRVFLEGGSVQSWREAREAAQARKENRTESPLVQEVWGQLDREAIGRNPDFGPDVVTALEERYGRGIFARGKDATGQRAANLDKAVQSLAYRGLVPAESTADDLLRHLAFGDALNAGEQTLFQPTREDIRAGDEALKRDAAAWAGTVDGYIENAGKRRDKRHSVTMLRSTPLVLQMLGAKNLRFNASLHLLKDGLGRHDLPADVIKQLPEALADPVMIFSSATQAGDLVVMLDLKDRHGGTVVVPVALEIEEGSKAYTVNMATTVYGKSDEKRGKPKDGWFAEQIRAGNLRYRNERKSREWQRKADPGRTHWGPIPRVAPRLSGSASRAKVFTEADLVKLREAHPTLYQAASGPAPFAASPDAFLAPEGSGAEPLVREGFIRKPDSAAARVVRIEENAVPEFSGMKEFANWLKDALAEGGDVQISSTGQTARFTRTNVGASVKRSRSKDHRNAYAALREMVTNAEYDHYEKPDVRHPHGGGQDVYHAALEMGGVLYSVKIKLDVVTRAEKEQHHTLEDARYKDHKLVKIEIAPALYRDRPDMGEISQPADAISEVTLGVLRGSVKPSGIDGGMLYQEGGPSQARGAYVLRQDGAALIALFRGKADISTVIHEGAGHFFLENLREAAQLPDAPELARQDNLAQQRKPRPANRAGYLQTYAASGIVPCMGQPPKGGCAYVAVPHRRCRASRGRRSGCPYSSLRDEIRMPL